MLAKLKGWVTSSERSHSSSCSTCLCMRLLSPLFWFRLARLRHPKASSNTAAARLRYESKRLSRGGSGGGGVGQVAQRRPFGGSRSKWTISVVKKVQAYLALAPPVTYHSPALRRPPSTKPACPFFVPYHPKHRPPPPTA